MLGTVLKEAAKIGVSTIAKKGLDHLTSNDEAAQQLKKINQGMLGLEEEMRLSHLQVLKAEKARKRDSFEIQRDFKKISADHLSLNSEIQSDIKQVEKITADNYKLIRDQLSSMEKKAHDQLQIKEFKEILQNASLAVARLASIGEKTSKPEIKKLAKYGNMAINIADGFSRGFAIGGLVLADTLLKRKEKPDEGLLMIANQFQAIFQRLHVADEKLNRLQQSVEIIIGNQKIIVENQQTLLHAISNVLTCLFNLRKENYDFYRATADNLKELQCVVEELGKVLGDGQQHLALLEPMRLCAELTERLEGRITRSTPKDNQKIAFGLSYAINRLHEDPFYNGKRWIDDEKLSSKTYARLNRLLGVVNSNTVAANIGAIVVSLNKLGMTFDSNVANPILLAKFARFYQELLVHKREYLSDPDAKQAQSVVGAIDNVLRLTRSFQNTPELWRKLLAEYKQSLDDIAEWSRKAVREEMKRPDVDITKPIEEVWRAHYKLSERTIKGLKSKLESKEGENGNSKTYWHDVPIEVSNNHMHNDALEHALWNGAGRMSLAETLGLVDLDVKFKLLLLELINQLNKVEVGIHVKVKDKFKDSKNPENDMTQLMTGYTIHPNGTKVYQHCSGLSNFTDFLYRLDEIFKQQFLDHRKNALIQLLKNAVYASEKKRLFARHDAICRLLKAIGLIARLHPSLQAELEKLWDSNAIQKHYERYIEEGAYHTQLPTETMMLGAVDISSWEPHETTTQR